MSEKFCRSAPLTCSELVAAILISTCNKVGAWQQHMASPLLQKLEGHKSSPSSDG